MKSIHPKLFLGSIEAAQDSQWMNDNKIKTVFGILNNDGEFKVEEAKLPEGTKLYKKVFTDGEDGFVSFFLEKMYADLKNALDNEVNKKPIVVPPCYSVSDPLNHPTLPPSASARKRTNQQRVGSLPRWQESQCLCCDFILDDRAWNALTGKF